MRSQRPITIIGGGLAGLALGIALRRQDVPVAIHEAGRYPRHRVCGEFISGRGQTVMKQLGLDTLLEQTGMFSASTARFFAGSHQSPVRILAEPAWCVSRYDLDATLADAFQNLGGELRQASRWTAPFGEGVVRASGRQPHAKENGWRWFGLKVHARNVPLDADLEMHVLEHGYVGVNRVNNGDVNVCSLFRSRSGMDGRAPLELLRGNPGSALHHRLEHAEIDAASFCSVAGLSLKPCRAKDRKELCIGDALTLIPPVTGNGMSMALECAALAAGPLTRYSRGDSTWIEARDRVARSCDSAFATRLVWARMLQWLMFSPLLRSSAGGLMLRSEWLWRLFWSHTRS